MIFLKNRCHGWHMNVIHIFNLKSLLRGGLLTNLLFGPLRRVFFVLLRVTWPAATLNDFLIMVLRLLEYAPGPTLELY